VGGFFLAKALELIGVKPQFDQRSEYKGYKDMFMETGYSPATRSVSLDLVAVAVAVRWLTTRMVHPYCFIRESVGGVLSSLQSQIITQIAKSRNMTEEQVSELIRKGMFLPIEARKAGLVDGIIYQDQVTGFAYLAARQMLDAAAKSPTGEMVPPTIKDVLTFTNKKLVEAAMSNMADTSLSRVQQEQQRMLQQASSTSPKDASTDAAATGTGKKSATPALFDIDLRLYRSQQSSSSSSRDDAVPTPSTAAAPASATANEEVSSSATSTDRKLVAVIEMSPNSQEQHLTKAFRAARKSDQIAAIVFRVNSPGGNVDFFERIAREVALCRKANKFVVASMGDIAASGGYLVSAPANTIFAMPTTITGSIGVASGRFAPRELLDKIGITTDRIQARETDTHASGVDEWTGQEWEFFQKELDFTYAMFKNTVALTRRMTPTQVEEVARGRIWTGLQAQSIGLVDHLGAFFIMLSCFVLPV
jgi:protease-4